MLSAIESYSTAKEVLAAAHHRFASKLQRALANSSVQSCDDDKVAVVTPHPPNPPTTPAPPPPPQVDPTLVGISPLLLERVRAVLLGGRVWRGWGCGGGGDVEGWGCGEDVEG